MEEFWFESVEIVQSAMDGLMFGSTYALIGIGFTLIFGVMRKVNLAFGAASLAGTYVSLAAYMTWNAPPPLVFAVSVIAAGAIGYLVYAACFRFIEASNELGSLMAAVGLLLFLNEIVVHSTEGMPFPYPVLFTDRMLPLGPFTLRSDLALVFVASLVCMTILMAVIYRTRLGLATRAVSQQRVAALLCGMSVNRTNAATFVLSGLLGGVAGSLIASSVGLLSPLLVVPLTVKGLIVTVIGGLGSIPGAIAAGLLVGAAENIFLYIRGVTERDIYVMLLLFVFLAVRPQGLLGRPSA